MLLALKDSRDELDTTGRIIHDDTQSSLVMHNCGILVKRRGTVIELSGERIAERAPLIATELGLSLHDALLDVRLLLVTSVENVEGIGLSGTTERVHDLVGLKVILAGVNHKGNLKTVSSEPAGNLQVSDSGSIAIGELLLRTLGEIGRIVDAVERNPTGHLLLSLTGEQDSSTLTGTDNELALLVIELASGQSIELVLKKLHGKLGVVPLVTEGKEFLETCTLAVRQTRETKVGVLAVLHLGGDTTLESVVLVLGPGLLNLPSDVVDPAVNSGVLHLAVNFLGNRDVAGKALTKLTTTDLVLETDTAPILAHGHRAGETDITNLTGEVVLDRSITVAQTLTGKEATSGNTVGDISTEELDLIDGVGSLGTSSLHDNHGIDFVEVTPDNLTESEPVNVGNEEERLVADTNIIFVGCSYRSAVTAASLYKRNVATRRSNNVPMQLAVIIILTGRDLTGEVGIHRGKMHGAHEDSHDVTGHLRLGAEDIIKVIVLRNSSTPCGHTSELSGCNTSWHKAIKF